MSDYNPRSAGRDYDWDSMTPDDAIEIVLERLADLHEAIASDWEDSRLPNRPTRPEGIPPHVTMVRWMPILADYQMFVRRVNKVEKVARASREKAETGHGKLRHENFKLQRDADRAVGALRRVEGSLRDALTLLDADAEEESQ